MRFSELARLLPGVSPKMLAQTLKSLERDGLLSRTATATVPVTVSCELTDLGLSLHDTVRQLKLWSEAHQDDVARHQAEFDSAHAIGRHCGRRPCLATPLEPRQRGIRFIPTITVRLSVAAVSPRPLHRRIT